MKNKLLVGALLMLVSLLVVMPAFAGDEGPGPKPRLSVGSCLNQSDNTFDVKIVAKGVGTFDYRLKNASGGENLGPWTLTAGESVVVNTPLEATWVKQYWNGETWKNVSGTHVTNIAGHTKHEFFCPEEEVVECVPKHVFVWFHESGCNLRQRGGPIGGQTRPFIPMQESYCYPCDIYPTDEGWTGRYINSCQKPDEYMYWNTLPQFNGCTGVCVSE